MSEIQPVSSIPFQRSYWVVPGKFLAGFFPGSDDPAIAAKQLRALAASGVRHVVNLMEESEEDHSGRPFVPYAEPLAGYGAESGAEIICNRFPVRDLNIPTVEEMRRILDAIDAAIERDAPVYVHCWGGKGRTGTVVGCWLVRHGVAGDGEEALRMIGKMRAGIAGPSPETAAQIEMVRSWRRGE